jgi:nucleotide-binding universal stress UspA family protein
VAGVVVGVARDEPSRAPVRWAAHEAALRGWPLTTVHAWKTSVELCVEVGPVSDPDLLGTALSRAAPGPAADLLLAQRADLLVVGSRDDARRLSAVGRACLHHAPCPVVVVHDGDGDAPRPGRVVVGVCGPDTSRAALLWAAEEAHLRGSELVVVHAWQRGPRLARRRPVPPTQDRVRGWVRAALGTDAALLRVTQGPPLEALIDASSGAQLLVLGRSSRTGLDRVVHGAVGTHASGLARCPVAVVPGLPLHATAPA